ncbi:hypothetical protein NFJ02_26g59970 [Pycnococcus provasolii]
MTNTPGRRGFPTTKASPFTTAGSTPSGADDDTEDEENRSERTPHRRGNQRSSPFSTPSPPASGKTHRASPPSTPPPGKTSGTKGRSTKRKRESPEQPAKERVRHAMAATNSSFQLPQGLLDSAAAAAEQSLTDGDGRYQDYRPDARAAKRRDSADRGGRNQRSPPNPPTAHPPSPGPPSS